MRIRSIGHRGLRRFVEQGDSTGLDPAIVRKLRRILSFLDQMASPQELRVWPQWRVHQLTGDRRGVWSISVTANWRITFAIDPEVNEIVDLNIEDYH